MIDTQEEPYQPAMQAGIIAQGTDSDDTLFGAWHNDSLNGGAGNDTLYGEEANDQLFGDTAAIANSVAQAQTRSKEAWATTYTT